MKKVAIALSVLCVLSLVIFIADLLVGWLLFTSWDVGGIVNCVLSFSSFVVCLLVTVKAWAIHNHDCALQDGEISKDALT
jgi:hypothetical protein